jgi:hypothetical protein
VSHLYVILLGGTVIPGGGAPDGPDATAIAWAGDTILAIGTDDHVRGISRGDSTFVELAGASVIPLADDALPTWPVAATLEEGGPASLAVLRGDPRNGKKVAPDEVLAVVRAGRVLQWRLPGDAPHKPPA